MVSLQPYKYKPDLQGYLKEWGVKRVFVTGLATDFCVAWTALDARKAAFETYLKKKPDAEDKLQIISMTLRPGEDIIVGKRLRQLLTAARTKSAEQSVGRSQ